jgi:hypothetical protein
VPRYHEVDDLALASRQRPVTKAAAHVLRRLEQFGDADIGVIRPADRTVRGLGSVIDLPLFGGHIGTIDNGNTGHVVSPLVWEPQG